MFFKELKMKKNKPIRKFSKPTELAGWQVTYRKDSTYEFNSLTMFPTYEEADNFRNDIQQTMMDYTILITPLFVEKYS